MKKGITILVCLLCVVFNVSAQVHVSASMTYPAAYKGTNRAHFHAAVPIRLCAAADGTAQAPAYTMTSTSTALAGGSLHSTRSIEMPQQQPARGIYTSASTVTGGVTTLDIPVHPHPYTSGVRRVAHPGECPYCVDEDSDGICDRCGSDIYECGCEEESGYCWCPLEFNGAAVLFLALLATMYALYKKRTSIVQ